MDAIAHEATSRCGASMGFGAARGEGSHLGADSPMTLFPPLGTCERCGVEEGHTQWCYRETLNRLAGEDPAPKLDHYDEPPW